MGTNDVATGGPAEAPGVLDVLADAHRQQASGTVEVRVAGSVRRLTLISGDLYLPADHPFGERLRSLDGDHPGELRQVAARIAGLLATWEGPARLVPGAADAQDLVGPLPTLMLLMERAAAEGTDRLLERLGGESVRVEATGAGDQTSAVRLLPPSAAVLLSRLSRPVALSDLIRQSGGDPGSVLADLARLTVAGLAKASKGDSERPVAAPQGPSEPADRTVPPDVLRRFVDRVGRDLSSRPLALDADSHRSRVEELLGQEGAWNAYQLLGVSFDADEATIHQAYVRLGRLVHPDHAPRLALAGGEAPVRRLFERATAAYLILSQRERRRRYDERIAIVLDLRPAPPQREEEAKKLAASYYERATALVDAEDFHFAVELLKQAVHTHPRPEYYVLLGQVQARNPNWLRHAADSYRKAVDLGAGDVRISVALGRICEEMGQTEEAKRHYHSALARNPSDTDARAGLARLGGEAAKRGGEKSGEKRGGGLTGLFGRRGS